VNRPEHGRLGGARRDGIGDRVDEHRDTERVRPEDELLAFVVGEVAGGREGADRAGPLLLGELNLGDERVQMGDECLHQLTPARIGRSVEAGQHLLGDLLRRDRAVH
jgi:hypothetical protein